jgi:tetratricopeptide (TPR) repeat protein
MENSRKKKYMNENKTDIEVIKILIEGYKEYNDNQKKSLEKEIAFRTNTLGNQMNQYFKGIAFFSFIILGFLSFFGWYTVREMVESTVVKRTEEKFIEYKKEIKNKSDDMIFRLEEEGKKEIEQRLATLGNDLDKKDARSHYIDNPLPQNDKKILTEYNDALIQAKREQDYSFENWYYKGLKEFEEENYPAAITYWTKALDKDSKDSVTYYNRAKAYYYLKQYESAIKDCNKAIELNPDFAKAYNNRGVNYAELKHYQKALEDYNKTIELGTNSAPVYANRGSIYYNLKDYKKAMNDFNKAIDLNPKFAPAFCNRGLVYKTFGDYKKAINDFNKAIDLNPKLAQAFYNRGLAYHLSKDYKRAISDYESGIELGVNYIYVYKNLSEIKIITDDYKGALDTITKALSFLSELKDRAVIYYLECITKKLLDMDTSETETRLNEILKENFTVESSFDGIELWLKDAYISDEVEKFITDKTELLKRKRYHFIHELNDM